MKQSQEQRIEEIKDQNGDVVGRIHGNDLEILDADKLCNVLFAASQNMMARLNRNHDEIDLLQKKERALSEVVKLYV